jgi:hypothetical protein
MRYRLCEVPKGFKHLISLSNRLKCLVAYRYMFRGKTEIYPWAKVRRQESLGKGYSN